MREIRICAEFEVDEKCYIVVVDFSFNHTDVILHRIKDETREMSKEFKLIKATTIKERLRFMKRK